MTNFTPFICKLEHLNGLQTFSQMKKRQMMQPMNIVLVNFYKLKHELLPIEEEFEGDGNRYERAYS